MLKDWIVYHPGSGVILDLDEVQIINTDFLPDDTDEWETYLEVGKVGMSTPPVEPVWPYTVKRVCPGCGVDSSVCLTQQEWDVWLNSLKPGSDFTNEMWELPESTRERLISGYHLPCRREQLEENEE